MTFHIAIFNIIAVIVIFVFIRVLRFLQRCRRRIGRAVSRFFAFIAKFNHGDSVFFVTVVVVDFVICWLLLLLLLP